MNFIFPKNYDFKPKLLGLFDYSTLLINIIFDLLVFCFFNLIIKNITIKVFFIISFSFPLLLLSFVGLNNENIFYVLFYLVKYFLRPKLYLYNKLWYNFV